MIPARLCGPAHARRGGGAGRGHAAQARGRRALARLRAAGQAPRRRRPHPLRRGQREHRLPARQPRRRGRGERARAARSRCASPSPGRRSTRPSPRLGDMPLPPYIAGKRAADDARPQRLSDHLRPRARAPSPRRPPGCISPTSCSRRLDERGIARHCVTLHVGAGTFLPVKADDTREHRMHAEWGAVSHGDRRRAQRGARQRAAASSRSARRRCGCSRAPRGEDGAIAPFAGETDIFITPGYRFRAVDAADDQLPSAALDAVHAGLAPLPGSRRCRRPTRTRSRDGYRFYSYGDACLLSSGRRIGRPARGASDESS